MGILTIHRICSSIAGPAPTGPALSEMLDGLTRTLAEVGHRPVRILKTESWQVRQQGGDSWLLARLRIECEPGEPMRPLACWYQWQHPTWQWSLAMLPTVDCGAVERAGVERLILAPPGARGAPPEARPGAPS